MQRDDKAFKPPLISIIIPSFNQLDGLKRTVEAITSISMDFEVEIIVADNDSSDGSVEWLLAKTDVIQHLVLSPDNGIYDGMHKGLTVATGKWIQFLGTGDVPCPETFSKLKTKLKTKGDLSLHAFGVHLLPPREAGTPANYLPIWDSTLIWRNSIHHQGVIYPRTMLGQTPFDSRFLILADYHLHLKWWLNGVKCICHTELIANVDAGGISRQYTAALYREERLMKEDVLPEGWKRRVQGVWTRSKQLKKTVARVFNRNHLTQG